MPNIRIEKKIVVQESVDYELPVKAADLLALETGLSKQKIKLAMKHGAVWLTQGKKTKRLRRADKTIDLYDQIDIYYDQGLLETPCPEPILLSDEEHYSVWYKPYGMLSQGSKWGDHHTINRYAEINLTPQRPAFIVHRLDRAASGLILLAHSKKAAAKMSGLFKDRNIWKHYYAIVKDKFTGDKVKLTKKIEGKKALSIAERIDYDEETGYSLLQVNIETGRKHQIRKHLADYGFPIVGDRLYGKAQADDIDLQLTAVCLSFTCPFTEEYKTYELEDSLKPSLSIVSKID